MTRGLALLVVLSLLGCMADQRQQLAECISEAEREYPKSTWVSENVRQQYVWLCMAAYGYRLSPLQARCAVPLSGDAALYAQCYEPAGKVAASLQKLEAAFRRSPKNETRASGSRP